MYTEFIAIFIGLGVLFVMMAVILVLVIRLSRRDGNSSTRNNQTYAPRETTQRSPGAVVFCKKCAAQIDASQRICPKCGMPRQ